MTPARSASPAHPRPIVGRRHRPPARAVSLIVAALLAFAASPAGAADASPVAASPSPGATYPLRLIDDEGTVLELAAAPQRIVSLSPANTEIVYALGAGDRLRGGTSYDDYPPGAAALTDVATFDGVLMEQVIDIAPDLVLATGSGFTHPADISRMRELGYPVLVTYAQTVPGVLADIQLIGDAVGESEAAQAITTGMTADLGTISAAAAATGSVPRTFYETGSGLVLYGITPDSFLSDLVRLAGGDPITTGDPLNSVMPIERLVQADPQVIVVGDAQYGGACPADVAARAGWGSMSAVRDGAIRSDDDIVVTRPGPRLAQGLASLARAIHPDVALPGFAPDPPICGTPASPAAGASPAP